MKEITPASKNRTQVAVNSEGKTNEATKKVKEPLKKGQDKPTEKQKTKQDKKEKQEQMNNPKQSRGRKDDNGINPYSGYRFRPVSLCLLQNGLENHRRAEPTILYRWLSHLL